MSDIDIDRPPVGTECCVCRVSGHFCKATRYVSDTSDAGICEPCSKAEDCEVIQRINKSGAFLVSEMMAQEPPQISSSAGRIVPREEWPEDTTLRETRHDFVPYSVRKQLREEESAKKQSSEVKKEVESVNKGRTPDHIRQAIIDEPLTASNRELARKYNLSDPTIFNIRKQAGLHSNANRGNNNLPKTSSPKAEDNPLQEKATNTIREISLRKPTAHPLVIGLIDLLPDAGEEWSQEKRAKWISLAHNIFDMIYVEPDSFLIPHKNNGHLLDALIADVDEVREGVYVED